MHLHSFWIDGYRSLQKLRLNLGAVTVIRGENGVGKTNVYRGLRLLASATEGTLLEELASEGGMPSITWAGKRQKKKPVRLTVGAEFSDLSVEMSLGVIPPVPGGSAFDLDPEIKTEVIWPTAATQRSWLFKRESGAVMVRDSEGGKGVYPTTLGPWEVGMHEIRDAVQFPELAVVRDRFQGWRFYHQFRTDFDSPIRKPALIFRSPVLKEDGTNLAAAMQTIAEIGDDEALDEAVAALTEGGSWGLESVGSRRSVVLSIPGLMRPMSAHELSDGQLRFLCLATLLLSPRRPYLIVLNEPETSLYDGLIPALARLINIASKTAQVIVTTHNDELVREIYEGGDCAVIRLKKMLGATAVDD